jgi:tRNA-specific 2-thiouridylase
VRAHAERLCLAVATKPESQEVCFLPDDDHARFVAERGFEGAGEIVDESGKVLGRHEGYFRYTVGQRRGLGVAAAHPLYVLRVEPTTRRVVVGPEDRLLETALLAGGLNWFRRPRSGESLTARIRHRGALIPCAIEGEDPVVVRFKAPARAVAPGQAIVFYVGDEVLGGGWIERPVQ